MSIRVLMLGWEFPPFISGGLGTACYGLTRAMKNMDINILMLLPSSTWNIEGQSECVYEMESSDEENPEHITFKPVPTELPNPYGQSEQHQWKQEQRSQPLRLRRTGAIGGYDGNLVERVGEYAKCCTELIKEQNFDVIHAHDWVTFPAGIALAQRHSKPLIVHIHATEYDRSGSSVNPRVFEIERQGMEAASFVIAVSQYTAEILTRRYGVPEHKIRVIHNGINPKDGSDWDLGKSPDEKIVLFLGRITGQKGPKYFVEAAEKVLSKFEKVKFIMAGWGDMAPDLIEEVAAKRLGLKIMFTGFLRGDLVNLAYKSADVYVMPSVSEPFGLTAIEAMQMGVPVIISKTAGVGEILRNGAIKIDFWDSNKIADTIIELLSNHDMAVQLTRSGKEEIRDFTWETAAKKCLDVYHQTIDINAFEAVQI